MKRIKTQTDSLSYSAPKVDLQDLSNHQILYRHPNDLINILHQIKTEHYSPMFSSAQRLRIVALIGFCHPVMNKQVESIIREMLSGHTYWSFDHNLTLLLEILNIISFIPGINYKILHITSLPIFLPNSYEQALWVNSLSSLAHGQYFIDIKSLVNKVSKENTIRVRQFTNNLLSLKEKVYDSVYNNTEQIRTHSENYYHNLDIILSVQGIITIDYFPDDYKSEYLALWVDRTVQLNSLLGNFVCKQKFGQFQYIRGPLLYAMQKGILLILNNFNQVSNELLVSLISLTNQGKITLNQKTIRASAGFKIVGIVSGDKKNKSKANINKLVTNVALPTKNFQEIIPAFQNQQNREFLLNLFRQYFKQVGYQGLKKLWKRIERLRKNIIHLDQNQEQKKVNDKLWSSFFTQDFIDSINLEIDDLTNKTNNERIIEYQEKYRMILIGRASISYSVQPLLKIVKTQYSLKVLEKLIVCFELGEYPLLISETGCGKTTLVQYLAQLSGHKLFVYNMSSGTDVTDLVGGFKPIDCRILLKELFYSFLDKFRMEVPGAEKNQSYLVNLNNYFIQGKIQLLLKSLIQSIPRIIQQVNTSYHFQWNQMLKKFNNIYSNLDKIDSNLVFSFLQGNLIKALKNGDWILIDQINLATNDVLQKIVPLIEGKSLMLYEKGDLNYIERHKDFRIVACMNPANDSGKKALPANLAQKFTTIIMSDPNKPDIQMMIKEICPQLNQYQISELFFTIKKIKTVSLRNLSRALSYINKNREVYGWARSVYDGLMLGFGEKQLLKQFINETIPKPLPGTIQISGFLLQQGPFNEKVSQIFYLTQTFKEHLKDFLRAIAGTDLPVLLEGPTSAGKTSMIRYVAQSVGYRCIRINNHEHTQIEEYIGNYFPDKTGKLVFREGPLVQAVKQGYWLILDQLNLAKTQILQCLNRLLDDNRQLFIPQQQKHIKPHPNFRIFATQNPSSYSGRKTLSRAFRNRFVSISFSDINIQDMMAILQARSPLLKDSRQLSNFVKKTLQSLINYRQRQRVFEKDGLITIRNLLKWCERKFISKEKFAMEGYAILAEKLRNEQEKKFVEKVLLSNIKYNLSHIRQQYFQVVENEFSQQKIATTNIYVQMNDSFKRMAALTIKAIANNEPVLLIGQTGCGKTTLAQLLAALTKRTFFSINCHKHMEASDLLGSLRPSINPNSNSKFQFVNGVVIDAMLEGGILLIDQINTAEDSVLQRLNQVLQCGMVGIQRGSGWETVQAKQGFCIIATMNPSGDYGKKELSPALRNRFTQIWVQPITHPQYIKQAKTDILKMINHKLVFPPEVKATISQRIYDFLIKYNCQIAPSYNLTRKLLTMRDIGWICKFINDSEFESWQERYFWSIIILAIEGIKYIMTDNIQGNKLDSMKQDLLRYLQQQIDVKREWIERTSPENIISLIKNMNFPLLIKINTSIQVLGIHPDEQIFFSPQTDLSDLLGQYRPIGSEFVWHDEALLRCVKSGGIVALVDLNMAQQQVIQGINSLFDHRGSLFVVELNQTFHKAPNFKPIVVLRNQTGHGRKGLPNSFLNRFVKLSIPHVKISVKLSFLFNKYESFKNNQRLIGLVSRLMHQQPQISIENIEFILQFSENGLLNESLQILQLQKYKIDGEPSKFTSYQTNILQLMPLKKSLNLFNPQQIKLLIHTYLVYKYSKFNICIIGNSNGRSSFTRSLAYLLQTNYIKILISTMVDINDLLGTYEQVSAKQQMQVQQNLQTAILSQESVNNFHSQQTKFIFVESQIIKYLRDNYNLIYVEVPSDAIAERIQKGLKDVYNLSRKIIIGIDSLNPKKSTISKFIKINLEGAEGKQIHSNTYSYFPQNQTNLIASDLELRQQETKNFIIESMNEQNGRKSMIVWRRILDNICLKSNKQQQKLKQQIQQKIKRQYLQKYKVSYTFNEANQARINIILSRLSKSCNRQLFLSKVMLQCFFISDPFVLGKKIVYFNEDQQYLTKIIKKFQVLYSCNVNNFKLTAKTIMPILFKGNYNTQMAKKYFKQIQRLYEQLFRHKIKQTLIQFNDQEHKLIPILNNIESIKYQMHVQNSHVQKICDQGPHLDHILEGIQKIVAQNIKNIQIDISSLGKWCKQLKIKHIGALNLFENTLSKRNHLFNDLLANQEISQFLGALGFQLQQGKGVKQYCLELFEAFKPSKNMSVNVSYHLKNEMKIKYFNQLIQDDEEYVKKYNYLCEVKYFKYKPSHLKVLAQKLNSHSAELINLQKLLLYRGYNNMESLIQFYENLIHYTTSIEQNNFSKQIIKKVIIQTFHSYYHIFNDILLPFYIPLIILYQQENAYQESIAAHLILNNQEDIVSLIENMIMRQEGEVDRSKDYLKFQRKFNRTVIVDQYTEEGVQKNKQILQEQFEQLFGKSKVQKEKVQSPFDKIHMLINKTPQSYYPYLSKLMIARPQDYQELIIGMQILMKYDQKNINIYEEYNPAIIKMLVEPLPTIMQEIHQLINKYPIDNIKNLANICNKIQERSLYEEIYKILIDCEFLIQKVFQVNAILPLANHIKIQKMIENCLRVRRLELNNWKQMMDLKMRRTQKSDMIEFIDFYKNVKEIVNQRQLFALCQKFLRESKLSCLENRINLLIFLQRKKIISEPSYMHVLFRVIGFFEYLMPDIKKHKNRSRHERQLEMKEYQKLAGWSSNQYLIFKGTCQKFQRKIHHILRRYDEELSITVGNFHQELLAKQFYNSIKEFSNGLNNLFDNSNKEEEQNQQNKQNEQNQMQVQQVFDDNAEDIEADQYQRLNRRVFKSLKELSEEHHNNQSKLFIIRAYLEELEEIFHNFTLSSKQQYKFITRAMFKTDEQYNRGVKYYYGLWDKLCQRAQTNWNPQIIDRVWRITQKIWVHINKQLRYTNSMQRNELSQDLNILFSNFISSQKQYHPIFIKQMEKVKQYLQNHQKNIQIHKQSQFILDSSLVSLMKLGYILGNISVNLQKNGLCSKQQEEQGENSENQQVGDGMGIGQGEAHEGAQNVGDQIQYQEQVMGNKDEQKNENDNAKSKQENDIQMEADFDGQMYSKEQQQEQQSGQQGQQKSAQEKMGDVEEQQKEKDMKNQAGEAEGQEQAQVDIKNQKEGEDELIDNQRQKKQQRKGEDKRDISEEGQEQQQKSDWDQNNQEGQKINKQKEDVQAQEESQSFDLDQHSQPGEVNQSDPNNEMQQQQEMNQSQNEENGEQMQPQEEQGNKQKDELNQEIDQENNQENQGQQEKKQQKKKGRQSKQYNPAYGRRDINTNNQVLNDQQEPAQQANNEGDKQQGQGEGNQSSGNPVHNLSAEFLQQILRQQKSQGNQKFIKDLNVVIHDQNEPAEDNQQEGAQQFELTEQKQKYATNLPLLDDQKIVDQKEENKEKENRKVERERQQATQNNKTKKEDEQQKGQKQQKSKAKQGKNEKQNNNQNQNASNSQKNNIKRQQKKESSLNPKEQMQIQDLQQQKQKYIRKALQAMKAEKHQKENKQDKSNNKKLLSESFQVSKILEQQLKSVLQPMDNAEYRGDFKTGKKLNLKKIIPFIASNFRKDRIWLRRTEPSERNYYVMIALDDTKSMHYGDVGEQALKGMLAISMALQHLSIKTNICSIRDKMVTLKKFTDLLNSEDIMNNFSFCFQSSNSHDLSMAAFMNDSLQVFKTVEQQDINIQVKKLCFIISDGKMNKKIVQPFMKQMKKQDVTYVFIIVDSQQSSILNIKSVEYGENKKMKIKHYMSDFPFEYFLIINNVKELGEILATTLMQFIQEK